MSKLFEANAPATVILQDWWRGLEQDRGARAELRRCSDSLQVMMSPAFQRLSWKLAPYLGDRYGWQERLADVVGLLAHVTHSTNTNLARAMAGKPPLVSELRFRRLLQRDRHELYGAMIRILRMLDGKANPADLMDSIFHWNDTVRKRWAFDYFPNTPEQ